MRTALSDQDDLPSASPEASPQSGLSSLHHDSGPACSSTARPIAGGETSQIVAVPGSTPGENLDEGEHEAVVAALQKNRALRAALASALTGLSQVEDTAEGQELCLSGKSKGKARRLYFASVFSSPEERTLAPPKNADAIRRGLFAEKYLGSLKEYTWTKEEDAGLLRTLEARLREEAFQALFKDRLQSHEAQGRPEKERHDIYDRSLEEVQSLKAPELWERRGKVDWKCVSERLFAQGIKRCPKSCFTRYTQRVDPSLTRRKFGKDEDKALLQLTTETEGFDWEGIAARMPKSARTAFQCFERYQRALNSKLLKSSWTKPEKDRLECLLQRPASAGPNGVALASQLGSARVVHQVMMKSRRERKAKPSRMAWTTRELRKLELLGKAYGTSATEIVQHLPGRSVEQVSLMQARLQRGGLQGEPWTEEEDRILDEVIENYGVGRWALASRFLPGRLPWHAMHRFLKRNPKRLADMYAILLATREKMIPKSRHQLAVDSNLVASDFSLHLYHSVGKDGLEITTGDPHLDQYLSKLNKRRKRELHLPKRDRGESGQGGKSSIASAPRKRKALSGRAEGKADRLASALSHALKTPAGAAPGSASSSSCASKTMDMSVKPRLEGCLDHREQSSKLDGEPTEGLCVDAFELKGPNIFKPAADCDSKDKAGPPLSPASTCSDDPMSDIEMGGDDQWMTPTEPFTCDSLDVHASPRSHLECP